MKSKLGQNFLIDNNIAKKEVSYAKITKEDIILEIGPGRGIITKLLAEKAKKVIAIEIDTKLVNILTKSLPENVEVINDDALKVNFDNLGNFNKIVSNLPYRISSPITFKFLEYNFDLAILIYQKEFADRMVAKPGNKNYSRLSVGIDYRANCKVLKNIPKTCFRPQPKVDSCMIKLIPKKSPPFYVEDEKLFFDLTRNLFNHRRKKIRTILIKFYKNLNLEKAPYVECRVEELNPGQIAEIGNYLANFTKNFYDEYNNIL